MLVSTTLVIVLGYSAYRRFSRGQTGGDVASLSQQL
jgi:hypothetical protein